MKKKLIFAGIGCMVIAAILLGLDLIFFKASLSESVQATIRIYPAAFFGLLGLVLVIAV